MLVDFSKENGKHLRIIYNFPIFIHVYVLSIIARALSSITTLIKKKSYCAYFYQASQKFRPHNSGSFFRIYHFQIYQKCLISKSLILRYISNLYCCLNALRCWFYSFFAHKQKQYEKHSQQTVSICSKQQAVGCQQLVADSWLPESRILNAKSRQIHITQSFLVASDCAICLSPKDPTISPIAKLGCHHGNVHAHGKGFKFDYKVLKSACM